MPKDRIPVYKFEKIDNFFSYFQSLDIQEYALKRIFQNFNYFMSYSYFCDAASAPERVLFETTFFELACTISQVLMNRFV